MKKVLLSLLLIVGFCSLSTAQTTIFEDFDSYAPGDDIVQVNPEFFEYWPGGNEGFYVSDAQAVSGSNSVYLVDGTGGDVILEFGDKFESGSASLSFNMYVAPGKSAYYNIQAEVTAGISWASEVFFYANGTVEFQNSNNTVAASATYVQGEWFEVRYDVNLDENIWELSLGGRCLASYPNPANSFASFNLYPNTGGEFWYDDMRFEHSPDAQEINNDVGLILGTDPLGGLEGNSISNVAAMVNYVGAEVTSATIDIDYDGTTTSLTLDDISVMEGDTLEILTESPIALVSGIEEIVVRITSINGAPGDDSQCNNNLFAVTTAVSPAPRKGVLVEEATGTWCTWCPRGAVFMEFMDEKYGDLFVGIAVHNADPMVVSEYDTGLTSNPSFSGFPSVAVERQSFIDPSAVEGSFLESIGIAPRGVFEVGANLEEATGNMDISINLEAMQELNFADNIVLAIVEDEVTGSGAGWDQVNAYAGGGQGPMGGFEDLPSPVPAALMVYEDVARALVTPYEGVDSDIPAILAAGGTKLYNFNFTLDPTWNTDHLSLVAILLNSNGTADNAMQISLEDALANGFIQSSINDPALQASFEIYPNPAADLLNIKLESAETGNVTLELINTYGQIMKTERLQSFVGSQNWIINVSDLPNGIYSARVTIGNNTAVKTVQKFSR